MTEFNRVKVEDFKVGDVVKVMVNSYGEDLRGRILRVVNELPPEDDGFWITKNGAKVNHINYSYNKRDFILINKTQDTKEVITPCTRNPETGNLVFGDLQSTATKKIPDTIFEGEVVKGEVTQESLDSFADCLGVARSVLSEPKEEYTGSSVDYYKVKVDNPTTKEFPYSAEANDIIEALGLTFAEGNLLKAVWRIAADRKGLKKKGNNSVYDAEKLVFFANRVLVQEKAK